MVKLLTYLVATLVAVNELAVTNRVILLVLSNLLVIKKCFATLKAFENTLQV